MARTLVRRPTTLKRMGPLTRQIQEAQNELVKLARRLDKLQTLAQDAEQALAFQQAEAARIEKLNVAFHEGGLKVKSTGGVTTTRQRTKPYPWEK